MKNKFKKSKIILPALALITATTVASVTGTVAWFTASRAVTVIQGNFKSETEGNSLTVTATGKNDCGTTTTSPQSSSVTINGNLTHGSFNAMKTTAISGNTYQNHLFSPNIDDDSVYSYNNLGTITDHKKNSSSTGTDATYANNKWIASSSTSGSTTTNTWYAVAWTLKFEQINTSSTAKNHLLLNPAETLFEDNETTGETLDGFRIALMTADNCIVIGGDEVTSHVTDVNRYTWKAIGESDTYNASTNYYYETTHEKLSHVTSESFGNDKANLYTFSNNTYTALEDSASFDGTNTIYYKKVGSAYVMQMTAKVLSDTTAKAKVVTATEDTDGTPKVTGEGNWSTTAKESTTGTIFVTQKTPHVKPTDRSTAITSDLYYLGEIDGTTGLEVTCVAWFEGTDTTAITTYTDVQKQTERKMSEVQATLDFYSRSTETSTGA